MDIDRLVERIGGAWKKSDDAVPELAVVFDCRKTIYNRDHDFPVAIKIRVLFFKNHIVPVIDAFFIHRIPKRFHGEKFRLPARCKQAF